MLYRSPLAQVGEEELARGAPTEPSVAELLGWAVGFLRRQWSILLSVLSLTIVVAAIYLITTPPMYTGRAKILIDPEKVQVFKSSIVGAEALANSEMMDTQIEILKSENFALSVIKNLGLAHDSEFVGSGPGLIGSVHDFLFGSLRKLLLRPNQLISADDPTLSALQTFEGRLTASRVEETSVIEVGFQSTDPDRAAQIANAVSDQFIVDQLDARYQTIGRATAWMQDRLNELRGQVSAADRAVIDYKTANKIVDTGGHVLNEQDLTQVNADLIKIRADVMETQARLNRLSQILDSADIDPAAPEIGAVTDSLHNEIINKLREQYLQLAQREAIFSARYGHDHLAVVNIRTQMAEINRSIVDELKQIAQAYRSDYDIAKARENSLEHSLAATVAGSQTTSKAAIELRQLESAAASYHGLYDTLHQRYTEAVQQQSLPLTNDRVITRATRPAEKSSPKTLRILAATTFGGLILGLGLGVLREISDRVFRTAKHVESELKTECLALIPLIQPSAVAASVSAKSPSEITTGRSISHSSGLSGYIIRSPLTRFAEAIRAAKVGVDLSNVAKSNKVIGLTSSLPNEGKSTIAVSLAHLCASSGARAILVDCDLRQPSLSRELTPNADTGLIEVISGSADLEQATWTDTSTGLSFLPAIAKSRLIHTSEILASHAMAQLFKRLRESYDYVIVDLSPLAPVVDVRSTTGLVDSYIFVIEWGKTKIGVVEQALSTSRGIYENLLGIVLNKVDVKLLSRYEGDSSDYYHDRYYRRYGYTD
jgi:succinoglycan biosynthesis transport protein ExoP